MHQGGGGGHGDAADLFLRRLWRHDREGATDLSSKADLSSARAADAPDRPAAAPLVIAPNLKRRLSGVTATIARLVPLQAREIAIRATGPGLPPGTPHLPLWRVALLPARTPRVWHARRNTEMLAGLAIRQLLRKRFRLLFTSASQRRHSRYTRWLIARMDRVIATSAKGAAYLDRPVEVVHHGIDTNAFRPGNRAEAREQLGLPDGRLVGCFGRIRHQKGTDLFVDAMLAILERHPDVHAVILGRATASHRDFEVDLRGRVAQAKATSRIHFAGEVPVDAIAQWYRALDLFVAPQRWEGFGLTPLEAMACGVPVLATRVGAFEELVADDATGRLLPRDDLPALITALNDALSDEGRLAEWGRAARAHVEARFTLEAEAARLNAIYREMLG